MFDNIFKGFLPFIRLMEEMRKWRRFAFLAQITGTAGCGSAAKPTRQAITVYSF
jgi:hypothetical protein